MVTLVAVDRTRDVLPAVVWFVDVVCLCVVALVTGCSFVRCENPYMIGTAALGCGQCESCLSLRRRVWVTRLVLESYTHDQSAWLTLTYDDDHVPSNFHLEPALLRAFLNRLRNYYPPRSVRYFGVGEYGDESTRPHYHVVLFGPSVADVLIFAKCWLDEERRPIGHIKVGDVTVESCAYTCGYVTKKMALKDDPRIVGRPLEFQRQSLRPGIGAAAIDTIFANNEDHIRRFLADFGDVPASIRIDGKEMPIGRYLKNRLRNAVGMTDEQRQATVDRFFADKGAEMQVMWNDPEARKEALTFKQVWFEKNRQLNASLRSRRKAIESGKKVLK